MVVAMIGAAGAGAQITASSLPTGPVQFSAALINNAAQFASTGQGFFSLTLTGVASGYVITNQTYAAWCASLSTQSLNTVSVGSLVYSTLSPSSIPAGYDPIVSGDNFNMVNYILNHKAGTIQEVQDAIWLIMTGQPPSTDSTVIGMVTAAKANSTYVPPSGGVFAVFYASGPNPLSGSVAGAAQSLFFEVPVPGGGNQTGCSGCVSSITLPTTLVAFNTALINSATQNASTGQGFFTVGFTGVGTGYSITNQTYAAWCAGWWDSSLNTQGTPGSAIYSTYSPTLPSGYNPIVSGDTFNMVNYILNHKAGNPAPTVQDIQDAIWTIMVGSAKETLSTTAQALVTAARANPAYCPPAGGVIALFYAAGLNPLAANSTIANGATQSLFIEIPCNGTTQQGTAMISMTKTASTGKCNPFDQVTYTYKVTNTGTTTVNNIVVTDDNGTPTIAGDDFTVGTIATLAPGASATLTATVYLPVTYASNPSNNGWGNSWGNNFNYNNQSPGGTLSCKKLSNGNIQFLYTEDSSLVDNTYGKNSSSDWVWWGNSFTNMLNSGAEFQILDKYGNNALDFVADYVSQNSSYPSGYGTDGIKGGGGLVYSGNKSNIVSVDTSLSHCLNSSPTFYQCTKDSPGPNTSGWDTKVSYTVTVNCGSSGFSGVKIPLCQNQPAKNQQCNNTYQKPVTSTVTNTATASGTVTGIVTPVTATAKATVTVDASQQGWSQCGNY
jgi:hypothetical protein